MSKQKNNLIGFKEHYKQNNSFNGQKYQLFRILIKMHRCDKAEYEALYKWSVRKENYYVNYVKGDPLSPHK